MKPSGNFSKQRDDGEAEIQSLLEIFHKWGIHTLGELAALDKNQLGIRLGPEAVRLWERASGKSTRLLQLIQPPESFIENFEFENEIETIEPLLFLLRRFLEQISCRLGLLYLVAKELKFELTFTDKQKYRHRFKIPEPTRDVEVLFRMLHTHLEDFQSKYPVVAVSLEAQPIKPTQQQFELFETPLRDPARLSETLARLVGLLDADRVGTPVLENSYRPDAFHLEPFSWQLSESGSAPEQLPVCVLRRFRPAISASILLAEDQPVYLRSAEAHGVIQKTEGPYHFSGNWWDEKAWGRAEWDLEMETGVLYRCHGGNQTWEMDGVYD